MKINIGIRNLDIVVDADDLLPCPCCGSEAGYQREAHDFFGFDVVLLDIHCTACGLSVESPDLLESLDVPEDVRTLVGKWNKRVTK
jgi:hypothetical protein